MKYIEATLRLGEEEIELTVTYEDADLKGMDEFEITCDLLLVALESEELKLKWSRRENTEEEDDLDLTPPARLH